MPPGAAALLLDQAPAVAKSGGRVVGGRASGHRPLVTSSGRAPLAQLAEQLTLNQRVGGSSPSRRTLVTWPFVLPDGRSESFWGSYGTEMGPGTPELVRVSTLCSCLLFGVPWRTCAGHDQSWAEWLPRQLPRRGDLAEESQLTVGVTRRVRIAARVDRRLRRSSFRPGDGSAAGPSPRRRLARVGRRQSPAGWWALRWSSVPYSPLSMAAWCPVSTVVSSRAMDSSER